MDTNTLNSLVSKNATVFIYDDCRRFSGYLCSLLDEHRFSPDEKLWEALGATAPETRRTPYLVCEKQYTAPLISFAKQEDILLFIHIRGDSLKAVSTLRTAKALGMKTLLLSATPIKEAEVFADLCELYEKDTEAIAFFNELVNALCSSSHTHSSAPYPIEHCGLSHSCFGKELNEKAFAAYKENDISHMEISFSRYEDTVSLDFKEYKRLADKYGITLWSYHLPFAPFTTLNPAHFDETVRKFTVGYFIELMKEAKRDAGISLFVMHGSGEPVHEDDRKASFKQLQKSIVELMSFADKNDMILAVENLPRSCLGRDSEDMQKILSFHPSLKMCFDLNHTSGESAPDIIKRFSGKIVTLHVSDFMGKDECHLMPGEGIIDWVETIRTLKTVGYKGPFLYEISRGSEENGAIWAKEARHTRLFTRDRFLNHRDVKENFDTFMNKAK